MTSAINDPARDNFVIPPKEGSSFRLDKGDSIRIVNDNGTQVVDFWCISLTGEAEYLSMEHCREVLGKIYYEPGDVLISNRYTPLLEYVADTAGGQHDTLIAACSAQMYVRFGREDGHPSCASNFLQNTRHIDWPLHLLPQPWNLFMRAAVRESGAIEYSRPPYIPGGIVELKALCPVLVVMSACPDDCYPTNGGDGSAKAVSVSIHASAKPVGGMGSVSGVACP
ncbi:urea carboxylase-associated family protein [Mesorhizobium sp. M6A.T.Cr.TU.016.01.1.1]|uniref:DUF1989 domain-containing protein n=1 Tax=Mesorhizobium sp. M6A.T.Cr.TU.016.01.1.1 TaxID=2493677 RepID=UPI000F75F8DA|nr:urea carboxylase-associated family protein [Mesorhizobium sp. M6A.T.Cr.TU.016.01.1.1]AZO68081.1 urea carboxylase-associated family protein [Mesorhizobium sp. M6A.T.Cr.TU.016.01.1.1]